MSLPSSHKNHKESTVVIYAIIGSFSGYRGREERKRGVGGNRGGLRGGMSNGVEKCTF